MTSLTKRVSVGIRYLTREGHCVGPIERIDFNGWAWSGGQCWDALTGQFYERVEDDRDLVAAIPEQDFTQWLGWLEAQPVAA